MSGLMSCTVYGVRVQYTCQQLTIMIWYCFRLMTAAREAACWDTPTTPPRPRPRHTTTTMATPPGRGRGLGTSSSTSTVHRSVEIFLLEYKNIFVSWKDWIFLLGTQLVFCHWIQIFFLSTKFIVMSWWNIFWLSSLSRTYSVQLWPCL